MAIRIFGPVLPCPECRMRHKGGEWRIGNDRSVCTTCNNWVQNVKRLASKRLMVAHPEEYHTLRLRVEYDLYPQVIEEFVLTHPRSARDEDW